MFDIRNLQQKLHRLNAREPILKIWAYSVHSFKLHDYDYWRMVASPNFLVLQTRWLEIEPTSNRKALYLGNTLYTTPFLLPDFDGTNSESVNVCFQKKKDSAEQIKEIVKILPSDL